MGSAFSTIRWESPTGGKFRIYLSSRFYDVYGLANWKPVEVQERIIGHPAFERVGGCLVMVELKPNGTHEIEFRKEKQWTAKQVKFLDCALDGLPAPYHWWGLVIIRPHLRIAKEAADKIASAKSVVRAVPSPAFIPAPAPLPVIAKEKKETKKVTISEEKVIESPKEADLGDKEMVPIEAKKAEETVTVEKATEPAVKEGGVPQDPPSASSGGKKGKKKAKE